MTISFPMPFNLSAPKTLVPASLDMLCYELTRRTLQDVPPVQRDILQEYAKMGTRVANLAIQLRCIRIVSFQSYYAQS
jgi:hypothetical protein